MDVNQSALTSRGGSRRWSKIRAAIVARDGGMCVICGSEEKLEVDHIIERQHGGTDHHDNLETLCQKCHKNKKGGFFVDKRTPPTPHLLLSPRNGTTELGLSSLKTESVSHG